MTQPGFLSRLFPADTSPVEIRLLLAAACGLAVTVVLALTSDHLLAMLIPVALLIGLFILIQIEVAFFLLLVLVPFSQEIVIPGTGAALQFPTEPLLIATILVWMLKRALQPRLSSRITGETARRIDIFVVLFLLSLVVSVFTSTDSVTSMKRGLNTLWYVLMCYFFVRDVLLSERKVILVATTFFLMASLSAVYALVQHAGTDFSALATNESSRPLFPEHGSYASYLAIVLGIAVGVTLGSRNNRRLFLMALVTCVLATTGVLFSYTRAAWLSVAALALFFVIVKARELVRPKTFVLVVAISVAVAAPIFVLGVQDSLERNLNSITDVESNLSNLERINRWMAAVNMIEDRPFLGVGYGTYADQYEIYRERRLETPVSNFHGSAHNDYLQFWAEAGILGITSWLILISTFVVSGVIWYYRVKDVFLRNTLLGCTGGVLTYLVHGGFNTFLHFDKVAVPFWVTIAVAVSIIEMTERGVEDKGRIWVRPTASDSQES